VHLTANISSIAKNTIGKKIAFFGSRQTILKKQWAVFAGKGIIFTWKKSETTIQDFSQSERLLAVKTCCAQSAAISKTNVAGYSLQLLPDPG
jgi:hypothetical protein